MPMMQTRRDFLCVLSAGAAGLFGTERALAADGPPEIAALRFVKSPASCVAPQYVGEELLRAEGFTEIGYVTVKTGDEFSSMLAQGRADFTITFALDLISTIEAGAPLVMLAGIHIGCYELFAREGIRSVAELKGKTVGLQTASPALLTLMAANVGLDPQKDIHWVTHPALQPLELFAERKIDAFLGFPPEPQELRARRAGHVIVSTTLDRPWSQYFCCMLGCRRDFAGKYPGATKRVLRAVLKATDWCASDSAAVARRMVDRGFTSRYDYAEQTVREVPYDKWRDYDPADSLRFYALRMREAGLIKATPQKILAENTDWRFLDEVKREWKT